VGVEKEASVVDVVENENPLSTLAFMQPVMYELKDVCFGILPSKDLNNICNVPKALLKSGGIARMDLEYPRFRRSLLDSVGIFNGELRFPVFELAVVLSLCARPHPTPPRPTSAV
jgi:hypothetical protein